MIDLHLHSSASDGALSPDEVVALAAANGVRTLALTDHDSTAGLEAGAAAAARLKLTFVPGVEVSVSWEHRTLHVVGLNIDASNDQLQAGLRELQKLRDTRAREIGRRLAKRGIPDAYAGARALAAGADITRTHFARHLHANGHAKNFQDAFKRYLHLGKPAHVSVTWAALEDCIDWIHTAGGQAVLAHPLRYPMTRSWLLRALTAFKQAGGDALEVVCGRGNRDELMQAAHLATRFELAGSVGSDFHAPGNAYLHPGGLPELPDNIEPVWNRFH